MPTLTVDKTSQTFYSTDQPEADVVVIHTTEGMGWPGYSGGASAPHATIRAIPGKGIVVREHIDFTKYAKALMNLPGGVETNRRGVIQFELVGTCDPKHKGNSVWYFWPDADEVVLQALADYLRPIMARFNIPAKAPKFLPYPSSYGSRSGQRMSGSEWVAFQGICGHQHVPENDHGDPGAFPIEALLKLLGGSAASRPPASAIPNLPKPAPAPAKTVWRQGDTGSKVRDIQRIVGATADGIWGPATTSAVKRWQAARGLASDGLWGPACEAASKRSTAKPSPVQVKVPAFPGLTQRGSKGATVRKVQERLKARGWKVGVDGIFGADTESIVRQFQAEKKLAVDGKVGPATWAMLWKAPVT